MKFSKVLACFLLLAALSSMKTFEQNTLTNHCLYLICTSSSPQSSSKSHASRAGSRSRVNPHDVAVVNSLFGLMAPPNGPRIGLSCNSNDSDAVREYGNSIECSCSSSGNTCRVYYLDLSSRQLTGSLPDDIGNLNRLEYLDLSGNSLSGLIPKSLLNLTRLTYLDLGDNKLEGPVPAFNSNFRALQSLYLYWNRLNGPIPKELGTLPALETLAISNNNFNCQWPSNSIGSMTNLQELYIVNNNFNGQLPNSIGSMTNLQELYIMNNNFNGQLPNSIGSMTNLQTLGIRGNNFSGPIPDDIYHLPNLTYLYLEGNNFTGSLPGAFSSKRLQSLSIADLPGDERGYPFPEIQNLTHLETLILRNCSLTGPIPDYVWQMKSLSDLDLSFNNLTGSIPQAANLSFSTIYLRSNKLNGSLPGWLIDRNGSYVDVSENLFTNIERLPSRSIAKNVNLFDCCPNASNIEKKWQDIVCANNKSNNLYINCGGNATTSINGSFYQADTHPYGASTFFLSNNLSSWGYSSMGRYFGADDNYIVRQTCNLSMEDASLYMEARVAPVSLKYYGFCLRQDEYIVKLHFAEIGWDPAIETNAFKRRVFDVEIQGKKVLQDFNIEEAAGGVYKNITQEFQTNVTETGRLEIHFYWSGKGSTYEMEYGPLISAISVSPVPKNQKHPLSSVIIGAIAGSSVLFVALMLVLFWKLGWLGGKRHKDGVELYPGGIFKYEEIKEATNNFDANRKIGESGTVYKGELKDGVQIAVKLLSAKSKQGALQVIQEIGLLYTLEHPNLAKPMGCYTRERQVLIVYKYMANISLQHALFVSDEVKSRLTWQTRVKICLGIAKGLAFLHEESKLDIIHSNIKPTNILLDEDFNVQISDFRYSELHDSNVQDEEKSTININNRRVKDTGHMAPEYMQGLPLTPKADVYSFGLVTLEIISGQPYVTFRTMEDNYLINTAYKYKEEGMLEALIDETLIGHDDYKYSEAVNMLNLAMQCVSPSFDVRPTMSEVVKIIELKKRVKPRRINPLPEVAVATGATAIPSRTAQSGSTS